MQKIRTNKWLILILVLAGAARLCGLSVLTGDSVKYIV